MLGIVEFFNNEAGWGKIVDAKSGEGYFIHHRDIVDDRFFPKNDIEKFRTLKRNQVVYFEVEQTDKPMDAAIKVRIVEQKKQDVGK